MHRGRPEEDYLWITLQELWPQPHLHVSRQRLPGHPPAFHNQALQYFHPGSLPAGISEEGYHYSGHQEGWLRCGRCQELPPHLGAHVPIQLYRENRGEATGRILGLQQPTPQVPSGFRRGHSTETAILRMLSDIYAAIDHGRVVLLALLDVSAAFDTVDHDILLERLSVSFGATDRALAWIRSLLSSRSQSVRLGNSSSPSSSIRYGVPQGSILGPLLYIIYTAEVERVVRSFGFAVPLYADDTQLYGNSSPMDAEDFSVRVLEVISAVESWMSSNRLRLNAEKTQFIWFGTRQQLAKRNLASLALISPSLISSDSVRDLGFFWTASWRWMLTSSNFAVPASTSFEGCGSFGTVCREGPCWPLCARLFAIGLTIVTASYVELLRAVWIAYSPSWTLLRDSSSTFQSFHISRWPSVMSFTGFQSSVAPSTKSVSSCETALSVRRHLIYSNSASRSPPCWVVSIFDLLAEMTS